MNRNHYKLYGALMSPFSMKTRAYLRYRQIPYQWITGPKADEIARSKIETYMVPVLETPSGEFLSDSTFFIDTLEEEHSHRRTDPPSKSLAFISYLLEDFADEWLLSLFFMHRWKEVDDQVHNGDWIVYEYLSAQTESESFKMLSQKWRDRQVRFLPRVSGLQDSYDILENALKEFLEIMEDAVSKHLFLFGSNPTRADFAIYGILSQLIQDKSSNLLMRSHFKFTSRWVGIMEDLSGYPQGDWAELDMQSQDFDIRPISRILKLVSKYHLPTLQANEKAIINGNDQFELTIDNKIYRRMPLERFLPCLDALIDKYDELQGGDKDIVSELLRRTGCYEYFIRN